MVEVVLGVGVVVVAGCENGYGVDVAVCACFGEGVEGGGGCGFDGGVGRGSVLYHGAAWLHVEEGGCW